jgi:hypothetical protein
MNLLRKTRGELASLLMFLQMILRRSGCKLGSLPHIDN